MNQPAGFSLLQPAGSEPAYRTLPEHVLHDLGLEAFCQAVTNDAKERRLFTNVLSQMTDDAAVAAYRREIFADILRLPELRKNMTELLGNIQFMKDFSTMHKSSDEELGLWHLFHRLDELDDYIRTVETMRECLSDERIQSEGLLSLRDHITSLYEDACFADMKKDIAALKLKASDVQSVTLGVNVNERFEAVRDAVKALLTKGVRTIYNTHMHKLGEDAGELSRESTGAGAASLIMRTEDGKRSFKVALAPPEGSSYARDIAEKYGVTYAMLVGGE